MTASSHSPFVVLKFGGTSVATPAGWRRIAEQLARLESDGMRGLVVVSALAGVTDLLQDILDAIDDPARRQKQLARLHAIHQDFGRAAELPERRVAEVLARQLPPPPNSASAQDPLQYGAAARWLGSGELLAAELGVGLLTGLELDIDLVDARAWLAAAPNPNQSAWAAHLATGCRLDADADWRARFAAQPSRHLLTQGFIVNDGAGGTALLGRGGSDTSAACFAANLRAERLEIWTDVPGLFTANPRRVPDARMIRRLDFEEAQEMATTGARVLHPRALLPCRAAAVPVVIRDTARPLEAGTTITHEPGQPGVKAIASRSGVVLVSMETVGMWQQVGFLADVFERFRRHGLSVDLIGSAETNVTVSLDPSENLVSTNVLDALATDLASVCRVRVIAPCAAISLVGRGMRGSLHRLADVLAEFGQERVHLISQSSNDLNLTFVVDEAIAEPMLPRLHALLVESGALDVRDATVFGPRLAPLDGSETQADTTTDRVWWQRSELVPRLIERAQRGTPLYVYHLPTVRQRIADLTSIPGLDGIHYAMKANAHPELLRTIAAAGLSFEAVSAGELNLLADVLPDLAPERVLFTPNFAPRAEYEQAVTSGITVTVDNSYVLERWPEVFRGADILLRVDPGRGAGHHPHVRTGGTTAKFGIPRDELPAAAELARARGARIIGLHAHGGSGIRQADWQARLVSDLAVLARDLGGLSLLDVGGGLAVPRPADPEGLDFDAFRELMAQAIAGAADFRVRLEPGRFIVAESGVLLATATQIVSKDGIRRIGVDAGMQSLLRPALYGAWHPIANLSRLGEPNVGLHDLVGPICESADVLARSRLLPATSEGDVIGIGMAGAYGAVMASRYNARELPGEDILDD